ncbi:2-polyprenyl-3-methyl-6-methoxy-1,4-benzoquinone monooxygenase [Ectothiorhodospira lacustris]|uniref:2-polyprenyl-3-methyl-6-methoxy-1,4-benzoquinone monooxygenase n=1 Tax=Ectothiorhodospira lacustris TaxID=2899127 RepID=UPI001EE7AC49|nr:2-polyprenyl-3-methyl-6-methoxy-1,4-benzoquinone monooxygenase [Ectothiorhodospira lacustris]MCG5501047.1 2-polyprenyl-3-methyl-6-methoxy-1,4-benzoquinone monooxygenase [Ectothiorhodospira lacustris]MCG5508903.1 2-polyprenyl-3-methyl-6-methoxy-1,4-benzoquinone monooxygenase [Ectothiorhodospira lacustris]MCG5520694.1 2-polyprenyl-3-methyl-6-methoxy-1,4-benzoquinone monooxygenase [Ectothiorhodospira lacustris]
MRQLSPTDRLLSAIDEGFCTLFGRPRATERPDPARSVMEPELDDNARVLSGRLMRINHAGEVAAQGLYQGQALTARSGEVRERMARSAREENDHLLWCERRLTALGTHKSFLNPLWYGGAFAIGALAGAAGDRWSLGFVHETEQQVIRHLDEHLARVVPEDAPTRAVLEQMKIDEAHHGELAMSLGGEVLPWPLRKLVMPVTAKVMTGTAWWI